MVYLLFLELLIHRLGDPKCVVSGISGCSHMFVIIRHFIVSVRRTGTFLVYIYIYIYIYMYIYIFLYIYIYISLSLANEKVIKNLSQGVSLFVQCLSEVYGENRRFRNLLSQNRRLQKGR